MKPKIYFDTSTSNLSDNSIAFMSKIKPYLDVCPNLTEAIVKSEVIIIAFVNTIDLDQIQNLLIKQKPLFRSNRLVFVGPPLKVGAKFQLFLAGLDQYLSFFADKLEILEKLNQLNNHKYPIKQKMLKMADLTVDPIKRSVYRQNKKINLRKAEFNLLEHLIRRPHQTHSASYLLENVWGYSYQVVSNTVQSHIASLRKKIDQDYAKKLIKTYYKQGYMLTDKAT